MEDEFLRENHDFRNHLLEYLWVEFQQWQAVFQQSQQALCFFQRCRNLIWLLQLAQFFPGFLQLVGDAVVALTKKSRIHCPLALQPCEGVILLDQLGYLAVKFRCPRLGLCRLFP